jgi:multisubunit Na+/H+ antiporter MnhB subunit
MAGTHKAPAPAWAAVIAMIVGFTMCTGAFVWHNNIGLWVAGGVIGAIGVVLAKVYNIMAGEDELRPLPGERVDPRH